jgi:hypothetical protein
VVIIGLIEEHVLPVFALLGVLLENAVSADSVFSAELLPKLISDCRVSGATYFDFHIGPLKA